MLVGGGLLVGLIALGGWLGTRDAVAPLPAYLSEWRSGAEQSRDAASGLPMQLGSFEVGNTADLVLAPAPGEAEAREVRAVPFLRRGDALIPVQAQSQPPRADGPQRSAEAPTDEAVEGTAGTAEEVPSAGEGDARAPKR